MSAITAKQATAALRRLQETMRIPQGTPAELSLEVMATLRTNCDDEAHLRRSVDKIIGHLRWFPSVAEVLESVRLTRESRQDDDGFIPMGCEVCDWTGYVLRPYANTQMMLARDCQCRREGRMQPRPADKQATAQGAQAKQIVRSIAQERRVG